MPVVTPLPLPGVGLVWPAGAFAVMVRSQAGVGTRTLWGYVQGGLWLARDGWRVPRSETRWSLYHLRSVAVMLGLPGGVAEVFLVATDIAAIADWAAFDTPGGSRNVAPDLEARLAAIVDALLPERVWLRPTDPGEAVTDDEARAFSRSGMHERGWPGAETPTCPRGGSCVRVG